jgi:hypothetical protein
MAKISIHPAVDDGLKPGSPKFTGGTLQCKCASNPVEMSITEQCAYNHGVWMHEMLETSRGVVLSGRGRAPRHAARCEELRKTKSR